MRRAGLPWRSLIERATARPPEVGRTLTAAFESAIGATGSRRAIWRPFDDVGRHPGRMATGGELGHLEACAPLCAASVVAGPWPGCKLGRNLGRNLRRAAQNGLPLRAGTIGAASGDARAGRRAAATDLVLLVERVRRETGVAARGPRTSLQLDWSRAAGAEIGNGGVRIAGDHIDPCAGSIRAGVSASRLRARRHNSTARVGSSHAVDFHGIAGALASAARRAPALLAAMRAGRLALAAIVVGHVHGRIG